jgi:iron complex transport system substrate-binding protein
VVCLEWLDPLYAAGHWVPEMVACAGGVDVLGTPGSPSVQIAWEQVQAAQPDALVLMPCGFSIARATRELDRLFTKPGWADLPAVRDGNVYVVDAPAYFNRPGPRLIDGVEILAACLFPSLVPEVRPESAQRLSEQDRRALTGHTPMP